MKHHRKVVAHAAACLALSAGLSTTLISPAQAADTNSPVKLDQLTLPAAATYYPKVDVTRNVPIVMRDGVTLYADVFRPADMWGRPVAGPFPSVLVLGPYRKAIQQSGVTLGLRAGTDNAGALAMSNDFVQHGYVQVVVDVRGTGDSLGNWRVWDETEQADYQDVIKWLRTQTFSNGRYGLFGVSYLAIAAMLAAEQQPPGLQAVFAISSAEDLFRDLFRGGDVPTAIIGGLTGAIKLLGLAPPLNITRLIKLWGGRFTDTAWPIEYLSRTYSTGEMAYDDSFYRVRSPGTLASRVNVPTFLMGGWWDIYQRGMPRLYDMLPLPPGQKQLVMGPWYHLTLGSGLGQANTPPRVDVLSQMWFDRWLKGMDNGIERFGPVTVATLGANTWRSLPGTPGSASTGVQWQHWHLGANGTLNAQASSSAGHDEHEADLKNPWCGRSTVQWTAGVLRLGNCEANNKDQEARAFNYTSEPLSQPLHISGPLALRLFGATTATDANWVVEVTDVAPNGQSTMLTGGALVASRRAVDASQSRYAPDGTLVVPYHPFTLASKLPVPQGEPVQLDIEIFNTDALIAAGHRLRLSIRSADQAVLAPPKTMAAERVGSVAVHHGGGTDSRLTLPVVPD